MRTSLVASASVKPGVPVAATLWICGSYVDRDIGAGVEERTGVGVTEMG